MICAPEAAPRVGKGHEPRGRPAGVKHTDGALGTERLYAHRRGWINDWEHSFYFDTWRKRDLSDRQMATRVKINTTVLRRVARDGAGVLPR